MKKVSHKNNDKKNLRVFDCNLLRNSCFCQAGRERVVDLALVRAPADLEKPFVAPRFVPRIGHQPKGYTLFISPSDTFDRMSSQVPRIIGLYVNAWKKTPWIVHNNIIVFLFLFVFDKKTCPASEFRRYVRRPKLIMKTDLNSEWSCVARFGEISYISGHFRRSNGQEKNV